jgi:hypothetical protein
MQRALTAESKLETEATRTPDTPEPQRSLQPRFSTVRDLPGAGPGGSPASAGGVRGQISRLQRAVGNQAVLRMLSRSAPAIQAKLTVNQPGDRYEQEADRVAEQVMRMPDPVAASNLSASPWEEVGLQRELQRKETASSPGLAPPIVHEVLNSPGQPLDRATRDFFEPRFGQDFGTVRVHTDANAAQSSRAVHALAYTVGRDIVFDAGRYSPHTQEGRRLLGHEMAHVIQQEGAGTATVQRQQRDPQTRVTPRKDDNPIHDWIHPTNAVLLIQSDARVFIVPSEKFVFIPPGDPLAHAVEAPAHFATDLGTLFAVPASGASATRIFQAGKETALVFDAGSDPGVGSRVNPSLPTPMSGPAAIYTAQLAAIMTNLGLNKVSQLRGIHGHLDHVGGIPAVVESWGTLAQNVVIPQEYQNLPSVRQAIISLRATTDSRLTARGFGSAWNPVVQLKNQAAGSDVTRNSFLTGDLVVEMIGLRTALKGVRTNARLADAASLMTKVTRRTDRAQVVILGDLRGQHIEQIKRAMEAEQPGSWDSFFAGTTTLSGFSHHVGALERADLGGIMAVLDATLLQSGRLNIVEQTNLTAPGAGQGRVETLELLSHLGADVAYTTMPPMQGGLPSSVTATKGTVTATGPQAVVNPVIQSSLTIGLARLRKLVEMQDTIEQWRPWFEEIAGKGEVQSLLNDVQSSTSTLRGSLRPAVETAVGVRAAVRPAGTTGPRDYSSTGGAEAQAYRNALNSIPEKTPIERAITPEFTRALEELRTMPAAEIPLRIAVHQAVTKGVYSDQAFTYLLRQLAPASRDALIYGKRGGPVPRNVAFQRVRLQVEFERNVLPGETWSVSHWRSAPARGAGVAVNLLMLGVELWNDVGKPLLEAHQTSEKIKEATQVVPFLRRIMFWQTMGAQCVYTGVHDPTFGSPSYITDPKTINAQMQDLDALYMQAPGLTDADILRVAAWLTLNVRNFDEFAAIFIDSRQDAVTWRNVAAEEWDQAQWLIRTGHYETSGSNHVEESWTESPKLTQFMQKLASTLISNTQVLLDQFGTGKNAGPEMLRRIGDLSTPETPLYKARLRVKSDTTEVEIPTMSASGTSGPVLKVNLKWWSAPVFYILKDVGNALLVTGADYNTYALLRRQQSEQRDLTMGGNEGRVWTVRTPIGNTSAEVYIDKALLERVPETAGNNASVQQAPAGGSGAAPSQPIVPLGPLQTTAGKEVGSGKGAVEFGPQVFQKPGQAPGKEEDTMPGAKIRF